MSECDTQSVWDYVPGEALGLKIQRRVGGPSGPGSHSLYRSQVSKSGKKEVLPLGFENKEVTWEGTPRGNRDVTQAGRKAARGVLVTRPVTVAGTLGSPAP